MKKVRSIAIVGGGSSGWMTAAYLSSVLFDVDITLVESRNKPTIGVGEATTPVLSRFMSRLGFDQHRSWLPRCDGTIKTGILFENWRDKGDAYWHPFDTLEYLDARHHVGHYWLELHRKADPAFSQRNSFYDSFFVTSILNAQQNSQPVAGTFAFHLNADKLGELLRCSSSRVCHIQDDVVDIALNPEGEIANLRTAEHGDLQADLYVDCTGFRGSLIRRMDPTQPYESYAASLPCDRAVVLRFPYKHPPDRGRAQELWPYVKASAQSSGWIWTIPLYSGISSGYVYSSAFLSDSNAELELRKYWGQERVKDAVPQRVAFTSGKLRDLWIKNCVAIGLSGSFIEPLESTGLAITQTGIELLASILDARYYDGAMVQRYNLHLQKFCDDVKQFITAHYCLTGREDTAFWRHVKHDSLIPADLESRLDVFKRHLPSCSTKGTFEPWFFGDLSWFSVLLGMDFPFATPELGAEALKRGRAIFQKKQEAIGLLRQKSCSHLEYLRDEIYAERQAMPPLPQRDWLNLRMPQARLSLDA